MNIQQVKIKKFKKLENISVDLNGYHLTVFGKNEVGKTSFLQFIEIALGRTNNIPPNAEGSGEVITDSNGKQYRFKVKFKDGKPVIEVTTPEGFKDTRKGVIANIVGAMDFDITEFVELSKTPAGRKKQVEIFKSFLPEEVREDLGRHERNIKAKFDERTDLNRDIAKLEAATKVHPLYNYSIDLSQFQPVNIGQAMADLDKANEVNTKVQKVVEKLEGLNQKRIELQEAIKKLVSEEKEATETAQKCIEWLDNNKPVDTSALKKTIEDAGPINEKSNQAKQLKADLERLEKMKAEAGEMTALIESSREAISIAIRDMDSPVEGLTYDDEKLIYNDVPVHPDSLSTSQVSKLGIKMHIAQNPNTPIFLKCAESYDDNSLAEVFEMADELGLQVIMEEVRRGSELTFEIMGDGAQGD